MASDRPRTVRVSALISAAARLESALAAYGAAQVPDRRAARAMADAFAALMRAALPAAGAEVHDALVTLCATETARARAAAAAGTAGDDGCRILDIRPAQGLDATGTPESHEHPPRV
jgi:hypothetical protein